MLARYDPVCGWLQSSIIKCLVSELRHSRIHWICLLSDTLKPEKPKNYVYCIKLPMDAPKHHNELQPWKRDVVLRCSAL